MARRTKEELLSANYYEWLEVCNVLRGKKKDGTKLTAGEKMLLRTVPSPEAPYLGTAIQATPAEKKKSVKKVKIDFDATVMWPVKAQAFLCGVYNLPYGDEQCMLLCEREDCPFWGKGYFRMHGVKF